MLVDVDAEPFPTLLVPHSRQCRIPDHPTTHCYRERELEDRVMDDLSRYQRRIRVERQPSWRGIGIPDIVTWYELPTVRYLTIFELKAVPVGQRAVNQITHYIDHAREWATQQPERYAVSGVLVAFYLKPVALPADVAFWQVDIA